MTNPTKNTAPLGYIYEYTTGETIRAATIADWLYVREHGEAHTGAHHDPLDPSMVVFCDGPSELPEALVSTVWEIEAEDGDVDAVPYRGLLVRETPHNDGRVAFISLLDFLTAACVPHEGFAVFSPRDERESWAIVLPNGTVQRLSSAHVMVCPLSMPTHEAEQRIEDRFGAK